MPYSLWTFNKLSKCCSVVQWERDQDQYFPHMHQKDLQQHPVCISVCCEALQRGGEHIHVPPNNVAGVSEHECGEQINKFQVSRVSCNATMLCLKAECNRFQLQQLAAWSSSNELTPRGEQEYKEVFDGINYRDITINLQDRGNDCWEFSVLRNVAGGRMSNLVTIPKVTTKGSYFGRCTCTHTVQCHPVQAHGHGGGEFPNPCFELN